MGFPEVFIFCFVMSAGAVYVVLSPRFDMGWTSVNGLSIANGSQSITSTGLLVFRLIATLCHWWSIFYIYFDRHGLHVTVLARGGEKVKLHLKHFERFTMFTVWSWVLQGVYFLLASLYSILLVCFPSSGDYFLSQTNNLSNITWILFELSFAAAFLVSATVTYVLIPGLRSRNMPTDTFFLFFALLFHNANIILIVIDALLNDIPVNPWHVPFGMLYALSYVLFSWYWFRVKGVFYYFFLDYEPKYAMLWYMAILLVV